MTISDEAFALLLIDNNYLEKWKTLAAVGTDATEVEVDDGQKKTTKKQKDSRESKLKETGNLQVWRVER